MWPGAENRTQKTSTIFSLDDLEETWQEWLFSRFPQYFQDRSGNHIEMADYHIELWDWLDSIQPEIKIDPYVAILPRGGGKSTNAELGCIYLGDKNIRRYVLYVSGTQEQADDHVLSIANALETEEMAARSPKMAERRVGKYGHSKGWRRNRLSTEAGMTVDAIGLDAAARGAKLDQFRPDFIIFDDIDDEHDTEAKVKKKIKSITRKLIPAGSRDVAILAVQNLVHHNSVFTRMVDGRADFLAKRKISGPHRALENMTWEKEGDRTVLTSGTPTWGGFSLKTCQGMVDDMGLVAFLEECQHEQASSEGTVIGDIWRESVHAIKAFEIPKSWFIYRAFDYGYTKPFSVGWYARSNGEALPDGRVYKRGSLFRIREWYGWNGKPNQGLQMGAEAIAKQILVLEDQWGLKGRVNNGPADASIYDGTNNNCVATDMARGGVYWVASDKSPGSRVNGLRIGREMLEAATKVPQEAPGFYVFLEYNPHWIRCVVHLPKDPMNPDDAWTEGEDHNYDEWRYAICNPFRPVRQGKTIGMY